MDQATETAVGKIEDLIAQSQTQESPQTYDFATPEFHLSFPVPWPNKEGRIKVTHVLRRPTYGEMIDWKKKTGIEREFDKRGKQQRESIDMAPADEWLWNQIARAFGGYPDIEDLKPVTEQDKTEMRVTHKEIAIGYLLKADADILFDECVATFGGGVWVMALNIKHSPDDPPITIKFKFREWKQKERSDFVKLASISDNKTEGKVTVARQAVNITAFADLHDELLIEVEDRGVVNGKTMAEIGRTEFARQINAEFKAVMMAELTIYWRKRLSD